MCLVWCEGEAGATGFTIYAELRVAFTPTDANIPAPQALTFTEIASLTMSARPSSPNTTGTILPVSSPSSTERAALLSAFEDTSVLGFFVRADTAFANGSYTAMLWKGPVASHDELAAMMPVVSSSQTTMQWIRVFVDSSVPYVQFRQSGADIGWGAGTAKVYKVT